MTMWLSYRREIIDEDFDEDFDDEEHLHLELEPVREAGRCGSMVHCARVLICGGGEIIVKLLVFRLNKSNVNIAVVPGFHVIGEFIVNINIKDEKSDINIKDEKSISKSKMKNQY